MSRIWTNFGRNGAARLLRLLWPTQTKNKNNGTTHEIPPSRKPPIGQRCMWPFPKLDPTNLGHPIPSRRSQTTDYRRHPRKHPPHVCAATSSTPRLDARRSPPTRPSSQQPCVTLRADRGGCLVRDVRQADCLAHAPDHGEQEESSRRAASTSRHERGSIGNTARGSAFGSNSCGRGEDGA